MKSVVLVMRRGSLAQGLMRKAKGLENIRFCYEPDYANADAAIRSTLAHSVLIEIGESGEYTADYCIKLCNGLNKSVPFCKLIIMCPERNSASIAKVEKAKAEGVIADFVLYNVSMDSLMNRFNEI